MKRGLVSWTLASIGDAKSGKFVREELIAGLEHVKAFWVEGLITFWDAVAKVCEGDKGVMPGVEAGVGVFFAHFARAGEVLNFEYAIDIDRLALLLENVIRDDQWCVLRPEEASTEGIDVEEPLRGDADAVREFVLRVADFF